MTGSLSGEASAFLARRRATTGRGRAGRARKVYGITEHGRELLVTLLEDPSSDDKAFPLKVALCAALAPARRLELFERRRAGLATQLAAARTGKRRSGERVDGYLRALREHDTADHRTRDRLARRPDRRRARAPPGRRPGHQPGGHDRMTIRLAIAGVGNCASSLVQGLEYYRDADPPSRSPGSCTSSSAATTSATSRSSPPSTSTPPRSASTSARRSSPGRTTPSASRRSASSASTVQRGPTLDGLGKYYRPTVEESPAEPVDVAAGAARRPGRRAGVVPPGRLRGGAEALRPGVPRRRRGVRQRHPGLHRVRPRVGGQVRGRRRADRRRRHQEPGRRHHRPPHPGPPVRGPRASCSTAPTS